MMASTHYALVLSLHLEKVENCMRIKFIEGNFAVISGIYVRSCSNISICPKLLRVCFRRSVIFIPIRTVNLTVLPQMIFYLT